MDRHVSVAASFYYRPKIRSGTKLFRLFTAKKEWLLMFIWLVCLDFGCEGSGIWIWRSWYQAWPNLCLLHNDESRIRWPHRASWQLEGPLPSFCYDGTWLWYGHLDDQVEVEGRIYGNGLRSGCQQGSQTKIFPFLCLCGIDFALEHQDGLLCLLNKNSSHGNEEDPAPHKVA